MFKNSSSDKDSLIGDIDGIINQGSKIIAGIRKERKPNAIDFNAKKGFICDMDGVLYHGNKLLPGAKEFIDWMQKENKRYLFLTNSSDKTPLELSQKLHNMGVEVSEDHFYTSALATASFLDKQKPGCSAYVMGESALLKALFEKNINVTEYNPDYVVIGELNSFTVDQMTKATNFVVNGARLVGTNRDRYDPVEVGRRPGCRAWTASIAIASDQPAYFCGKPNPMMVRDGLNLLGCADKDTVFVGDRMDTDIVAGTENGIDTVLVLSGASTLETLNQFAFIPTMILDGVGNIVECAER